MRYKESINDKNLFKAVFMAGGPGSGKSFIANNMFAFGEDNISFTGAMLVNTDTLFEIGLRKAGLPFIVNLDDDEMYKQQMAVRQRAIELTECRQAHWINSMLPLIIDGTGKDFEKIKRQSDALRSLGYDTAMVFVNTTLETAQKRNKQRPRSLDPIMIKQMWQMVQVNIGKFQDYFGVENFIIIDCNDTYDMKTPEGRKWSKSIYNKGLKLLQTPLKNRLGLANIAYLKEHGGKYLSDLCKDDKDTIKESRTKSWKFGNRL